MPTGIYHRNDQTKLNISIALKGRKLSSEHKAAISKANKGHIVTKETNEKISLANKGKLKGKHNSLLTEFKKGHISPLKNKPLTKKMKLKISDKMISLWQNKEYRKKMLLKLKESRLKLKKEGTEYSRNKDKYLKRAEEYYKNNKNKIITRNNQWAKNNPDKVRIYSENRRAAKLNLQGKVTLRDILRQYNLQQKKCFWCNKDLHNKYNVDHKLPLSKGGKHTIGNIVISCPTCNGKKSAMLAVEFKRRMGIRF